MATPAEETNSFTDSFSMHETFQKKYDEFAADLVTTFPELTAAVEAAKAIPADKRMASYKEQVMTAHAEAGTTMPCPGPVLPGVTIAAELWETAGKRTKKAVYEYLSILDLSTLFETGADGAEGFSKDWADKVMREWRSKFSKVDFESMSEKFFKLFGAKGDNLPPLPEKFLKGKLAKLAEDMVREFNPADFGLSPEDLEACERDPTRAFEILMKAATGKPEFLQKAMGRVAKRLQDKVARGELKPQELVAEAEELIKEFQTHPAFVELMESFRSMFSFEDPDLARSAGRDGEGRLAQAQARLRKKLEARRGGKK